jgi:hypothetical protein
MSCRPTIGNVQVLGTFRFEPSSCSYSQLLPSSSTTGAGTWLRCVPSVSSLVSPNLYLVNVLHFKRKMSRPRPVGVVRGILSPFTPKRKSSTCFVCMVSEMVSEMLTLNQLCVGKQKRHRPLTSQ